MRAVPGCFLQVAGAMREIFLVPSSQCCVQLLLDELFMAVVFQISFSLKDPQQDRCSCGSPSREAMHPPVRPIRCSVPAPWCLPWAQSRDRGSTCDRALLCMQECGERHTNSVPLPGRCLPG